MKEWIKCAGTRAVKTVAQTAVSLISVGTVMSDIDWLMVGSASLLAGILSLLTSIAGIPELDNLKEERLKGDEENGKEFKNIRVNCERKLYEPTNPNIYEIYIQKN